MNIELYLLKFLFLRESFLRYGGFIEEKFLKDNSPDIHRIFQAIASWHEKYPAKNIVSLEEFGVFYATMFSLSSQRELESFSVLCSKLESITVEESVAKDFLTQHIQRSRATQAALIALEVAEGKKPAADLQAYMQGFEADTSSSQNASEFTVLSEEGGFPEEGLRWALRALNQSLGSLRQGDNGFIFARPEAGKTTFAISQGVFMAEQLVAKDLGPCIYATNEQSGDIIMQRAIQSLLGISPQDFFKYKKQAIAKFNKRTDGRFLVYDKAYIQAKEFDGLARRHNPSLIIFDQLDKVKGFSNSKDRDDMTLKQIYQWARELSKQYGPVIGVSQASVSAEGKKYLTMDDVDGSKCLHPDTLVLMADGLWKPVKEIIVGEYVMGTLSQPKQVFGIGGGYEEMYRITHKIGGDSYIVNKSHILTMKNRKNTIVDVPLSTVLQSPDSYRSVRSGYELPDQNLPFEPYWFGLWLGDGQKNKPEITTIEPEIKQYVSEYAYRLGCTYTELRNGPNPVLKQAKIKFKQGIKHPVLEKLKALGVFNNKHVPDIYLTGSINQRLELLAGLLDSDGTLAHRKHYYYVFSNTNQLLVSAVKQLALSCGFMSIVNHHVGHSLVSISGDISKIPCRVARKKCPVDYFPKRDVTTSKLIIEAIGVGEYRGITLDGDRRFIIENCVVTHNTAKQGEADWILGIGASHQAGLELVRHFALSKNKLVGDQDTDPKIRHGKFDVRINPLICRYEDI